MHPEVGYIFLLNGFAANYLGLFYNRKKNGGANGYFAGIVSFFQDRH